MAYLGGTEVRLLVDLFDKDAVKVAYRILNHKGEEILARTEFVDVEENPDSFEIIVPAELNEVGEENQREIRLVEIYIQTPTGTIKNEETYVIESEITLVTGVNSFQTYPEALMTALTLTDIEGWESADKDARVTAMIAARRTFGRLRFRYVFDSENKIIGDYVNVKDITQLTVDEFNNLPFEFREALKRAQILEVSDMLRTDDWAEIEKLAAMGVTRTEVYEAKISLGTGRRRVRQTLCDRAMDELAKWLWEPRRIRRVE